ncbi:MAG: glycosyltransferase family 2 protein [Planctomycetota bacterium]
MRSDTKGPGGRLSVVIPAYNEANTIEKVVARVRALDVPKEIIVVDDGSRDGTREILGRLREAGLIDQLILHEQNRGKGAALQSGFDAATGDWVIVQDADLEYDPNDIPRLLQPILDEKADVVYGSRFQGADAHRVLFFWHYVANRLLTLASNMLTNLNLTDMETCYKLFRREVLAGIRLRERRFGVEPEITAKVAKIPGIRVYEVGISYAGRTYAEGKKIGWRDAFSALRCIVKYNLFR